MMLITAQTQIMIRITPETITAQIRIIPETITAQIRTDSDTDYSDYTDGEDYSENE